MILPKDLRNTPESDILDELGTYTNPNNYTGPGTVELRTQLYLSELARREQDRQTGRMVRCTNWITVMTFMITLMTAANLLVTYLVMKSPH